MAFSAVALAYMLRISLSYAITQMVYNPHAHENGSVISNPDVCPPYEDEEIITYANVQPISTIEPATIEKFDWSQELQGLILSSFYWGYLLTHIPGGLLSAKVGGKYTLLLGVVISTVFTLLTPIAVRNGEKNLTITNKIKQHDILLFDSGGSTALIIFRIIIGMGEGVIFPSCESCNRIKNNILMTLQLFLFL